MISQTAEHAIRACLYLAAQPGNLVGSGGRGGGEGGFVPAEVIADAVGAPRNYLSKTLRALAAAGVLSSFRGPQGGFRLAVDPASLALAEVVAPFDLPERNPICLLGGRPCSDGDPCRPHAVWSELRSRTERGLRCTTVAHLLAGSLPPELIDGPSPLPPLPRAGGVPGSISSKGA